MNAQISNKITPTLRRALIQASPFGRVAILKPVFEGDPIEDVEVLEVLKADNDKKMKYSLHHVDGLTFDVKEGKFNWEYADGFRTKSRYGSGYYFHVTGIIKKQCRCIPIKKTEDIGKVVPELDDYDWDRMNAAQMEMDAAMAAVYEEDR